MAPAPAREGLAPAARALGLLAMLLAVALAAPPWTLAQTAASPPSAAPALPTDPAQPCPAPTSLQNAAPAGADAPVTDYAIVIDVSGSMNGDYNPIDGTPDAVDPNGNLITPDRLIFPKVKDAVERFIASLPPDANVAIIPFGSGVDPSRTRVFPLASAGQADAARAYVAGLQARDGFTHITEAV
ncbi:MAG TPA: vWA domain-containing protein, partial [Thermomicrobiales bacterium]|nr:vWA domain-containing protein [Thermomicrobiales bacterium]